LAFESNQFDLAKEEEKIASYRSIFTREDEVNKGEITRGN
jgi:hypothetical protein